MSESNSSESSTAAAPERPAGLPDGAYYELDDGEGFWLPRSKRRCQTRVLPPFPLKRDASQRGALRARRAAWAIPAVPCEWRTLPGRRILPGQSPWAVERTRRSDLRREMPGFVSTFHREVWKLTKTYERGVTHFNMLCYSRAGVEVDQWRGKPVPPSRKGCQRLRFSISPTAFGSMAASPTVRRRRTTVSAPGRGGNAMGRYMSGRFITTKGSSPEIHQLRW